MLPQHATMSSLQHIDTSMNFVQMQECAKKAYTLNNLCEEHQETIWRVTQKSCISHMTEYFTMCVKYWELEKVLATK